MSTRIPISQNLVYHTTESEPTTTTSMDPNTSIAVEALNLCLDVGGALGSDDQGPWEALTGIGGW